MRTRVLEGEIAYDGSPLRSGWIAETAGLAGDAGVAFSGPCDVSFEHMVDTVDLDARARICSPRMLHLIIEHPGADLILITTRQRLLMARALELLHAQMGEPLLRREGDDLYLRDRKLSISVATVSPTSGLIHAAFNYRGEGAPVAAIGLEELGVLPREFGPRLLSAYATELDGIAFAASKVRPVK